MSLSCHSKPLFHTAPDNLQMKLEVNCFVLEIRTYRHSNGVVKTLVGILGEILGDKLGGENLGVVTNWGW